MIKELVYICSPLGASTQEEIRKNMDKARKYMKIVSEKLDCRALAPHAILPEYLDERVPEERQLGLKFGLDLLRICKKIVICGDVISKGMSEEIRLAERLGIEILHLKEQTMPKVKIAIIEIEGDSDGLHF